MRRPVRFEWGPGMITKTGSLTASVNNQEGGHAMRRVRWAGPIGFENMMTGDGRLIEADGLVWSDLPIPMRYVSSDVGAHDGAVTVGVIDTIERRDGGVIWGEGFLDLRDTVGEEAVYKVREQIMNGVSMDLDSVSFEIRVKADLLEEMNLGGEEESEKPELKVDEEGRATVMEMGADDEVMVTTSANIRGATIVAIPAFSGARINLEGDPYEVESEEAAEVVEALVAAGGPVRPPLAWFQNPQFDGPTPLTVTPSGRVYGHLATWDTCHIAYDICTTAPTSDADYSYFHVGGLLTKEGNEIGVGHITLGTGHADPKLRLAQAMAHYDNTGAVVADIRVGEDQFGIWFSGAIRPGLSERKIRELRSAPLSGDWREAQGNLELVAALAVNVPGFPVPRPSGMVASGGKVVSLVASSGAITPAKGEAPAPARAGEPPVDLAQVTAWIESVARRAVTDGEPLSADQMNMDPETNTMLEGPESKLALKAKVLRQRMKNLSARQN